MRKPKGHRQIRVVVNTQEYPLQYSQEELYKKYLIYWRASHDELVLTLNTEDTSFKKRRHHAEKIIENLEQMRQLLPAELQVSLDVLILKQQDILSQLSRRKLSRTQRLQIISLLKKQKRQIQKEFNCPKIQEYLEEK